MVTVLIFLSGIAIGHCFFLAIYLALKGRNVHSYLLSALLVMIAIRIGKSLTSILLPQYSHFLSGLGLVAMSFIGPISYAYIKSYKGQPLRLKTGILHLSVTALWLINWIFADGERMYQWYQFINAQFLAYLILIFFQFNLYKSNTSEPEEKWLLSLWTGLLLISIASLLQLFIGNATGYLIAALAATIVIYTLSLVSAKQYGVLSSRRTTAIDTERSKQIAIKIDYAFSTEQLYLTDDLSLNNIANRLQLPSYLISQIVNAQMHLTFSELVLKYRIDHACKLLIDANFAHYKIEAIGLQSGFRTASSFYSAFKKIKGITPSQFRENHSAKSKTDNPL